MQPNISCIICATPRTGGSLLCEALKNTGVAGQPEEYFNRKYEQIAWGKVWNIYRTALSDDQLRRAQRDEFKISSFQQLVRLYRWDASTFEEYLTAFIEQGTTPNGVYGVHLLWDQFDDLVNTMRQVPAYKGLSVADCMKAVFPNPHYIWIKRRDKVRQAVSYAKGVQTNIWSATTDSPLQPMRKPAFSFQLIDLMVHQLEAQEAAWGKYFMKYNIQPFVVIYEDFESAYEETALQILKELDVPNERVTFGPRRLKRQADEESEQWIQRYYDLETHSRWCRWLSHLDKLIVVCLVSPKLAKLRKIVLAKIYLKLMCVIYKNDRN